MYFDSFRTLFTKDEILESDKFYRIETKESKLKYYLNSSIVNLFREINAFQSLGDGVLKTPVYEVENILVPKILPTFSDKKYSNFLKREIQTVFKEVKQADRKDLDSEILESLTLDAKSYLPKIYDGLCELVKERLELPKMRKKRQKDKGKNAYDKVKEDVIEDCLPDGIRTFPQDFYDKGNYDELKFETYPMAGTPLTIEPFFTRFEMKTSEGKTIIELDSEVKAEFAALLSRKETFQIKIPLDEKVVEQILKKYHNYISTLSDQLTVNAREKLHDWSLAERMSKEILSDFGIEIK
jgi:hypothetical protein